MIYKIRSTHRKNCYYDGKIGLKLRVQMEPLVCNPKNKNHNIKNASSKMEKLPISYFVSCYSLLLVFSNIFLGFVKIMNAVGSTF